MAVAGIFENGFGEVRPDRVVFNVRKSIFGGQVREDFPIKHITSVRFETKRWPIWGIIFGLFGLGALSSGEGAAVLIGLVLLAIAALLIVGVSAVAINTAGGETRVSLGKPLQGEDAQAYARAVREALFAIS